jgi:hypothetical protein
MRLKSERLRFSVPGFHLRPLRRTQLDDGVPAVTIVDFVVAREILAMLDTTGYLCFAWWRDIRAVVSRYFSGRFGRSSGIEHLIDDVDR